MPFETMRDRAADLRPIGAPTPTPDADSTISDSLWDCKIKDIDVSVKGGKFDIDVKTEGTTTIVDVTVGGPEGKARIEMDCPDSSSPPDVSPPDPLSTPIRGFRGHTLSTENGGYDGLGSTIPNDSFTFEGVVDQIADGLFGLFG